MEHQIKEFTLDTIRTGFGAYPYDHTGKIRPIKWRILEKRDNKVLLISEMGLDIQPYNSVFENTTWEDSFIRKWLNTTFINLAFTKEEQDRIISEKITGNPKENSNTDTSDKVFLLSEGELEKYFLTSKQRIAKPTPYVMRLAMQNEPAYWWWLRTSTCDRKWAVTVTGNGIVWDAGSPVSYHKIMVRPALWVKIDKTAMTFFDQVEFGFGTYPYSNTNDEKPIQWRLLEDKGDRALFISKQAIDAALYHRYCKETTWEDCTLRQWLNNEFFKKAFSREEQAHILTTKVSAEKNPEWGIDPGNDTMDKVFLLSIDEAKKYFKSDEDRLINATPYANLRLKWMTEKSEIAAWWLRSPGAGRIYAAFVDEKGRICESGIFVGYPETGLDFAVRPAIWVKKDIVTDDDIDNKENRDVWICKSKGR